MPNNQLIKRLLPALLLVITPALASSIDKQNLKLEIGEAAPLLVLSGQAGEKLNGGGWNSKTIGGKVTVVMYVDPDNEGDNLHVEERLQKDFKKQNIKVFGIVNADATFIPNFMLRRRLSSKQSHNELLTIVMDYKHHAEKVWGLKDERYNVMAFDKDGKLFFIKQGKLNPSELEELISAIKSHASLASNS